MKVETWLRRALDLLGRLRRPSTVYLVTGVLNRVAFLALVPLYSRRLGLEEYADYVLVQTAIGLAPIFSLCLPISVSRFYFAHSDIARAKRDVGAVTIWSIVVTLGICGLFDAVIWLMPHASRTGLFAPQNVTWALVAAGGSSLSLIAPQYLRDLQRPIAASVFQISECVLLIATGYGFVLGLGQGFPGTVRALGTSYAMLAIAGVTYVLGTCGAAVDRASLRKALGFSLPFVPHFMALWVQGVADRWGLKLAGRGPSLGPYALSCQLSAPVAMAANAYNWERSARTGELFRQGGLAEIKFHIGAIRRAFVVLTFAVSVVLVLSVPVLRIAIGNRFPDATVYLPVLCFISIIDSLYYPNNHVAYYASRSRAIATVTTISAGASVAASVAFIPWLGVWGAILARGVSASVRSGAMWYVADQSLRAAKIRLASSPLPSAASPSTEGVPADGAGGENACFVAAPSVDTQGG